MSDELTDQQVLDANRRETLYGVRVARTPMLDMLRQTLKKVRLTRVEEILATRCASVQILLENVEDPRNGASCLRSADSMGICYLNVVEFFRPFAFDQGLAEGSDEHVEIKHFETCDDATKSLKAAGFTLIATTLDEKARPISDLDFHSMPKVCIMFGNEERGLSQKILESADERIFLPMIGMVESLNVSVSISQCLYHLHLIGRIRPDLDDAELSRIYEKWVINHTKSAKHLISKHKFDYKTL